MAEIRRATMIGSDMIQLPKAGIGKNSFLVKLVTPHLPRSELHCLSLYEYSHALSAGRGIPMCDLTQPEDQLISPRPMV